MQVTFCIMTLKNLLSNTEVAIRKKHKGDPTAVVKLDVGPLESLGQSQWWLSPCPAPLLAFVHHMKWLRFSVLNILTSLPEFLNVSISSDAK